MSAQPVLRRASRFGVTGVLTTLVHIMVAVVMVNGLAATSVQANGTAFVVATVFSYVVNTLWSFSSSLHGRNLLKYCVVAGVGFLVAVSVSKMAELAGLSYLWGTAFVVMTVPPVNFVMHHFWTYR